MRFLAPAFVLAAAMLVVAGCEKGAAGASATSWTLDAETTIRTTDGSETAWVKKHLEGLTVDLECRADGTYVLKVTGGDHPGETHGTYKAGWGEVILFEDAGSGGKKSDGLHLKGPDKDHLRIVVGGLRATLRRA